MSRIEQNVMGSVAAIYAFRLGTGFTALKLYALMGSLAGIVFFVSVGNVFQNLFHVASAGAGSVPGFILSAVFSTTAGVQVALLLGALAAVSLLVDFVRAFSVRGGLFA
jgi:hypothetical protein